MPIWKCAQCGHTYKAWSWHGRRLCNKCSYDRILERNRSYYKPAAHNPLPCVVCGEMFTPTRSDAKYCRNTCKSIIEWHALDGRAPRRQYPRAAELRE